MLSRKTAGTLSIAFLMLSGLASADEGDLLRINNEGLAPGNYVVLLSAPVGWENAPTYGTFVSGSVSQPGTWTLSIFAQGMEGYVLNAVVTGTGGSGFTGVSLQSTTATPAGYFGPPIVLASTSEPTSYVAEPSTANFMFTGIFFAFGMVRRRVLSC